MDTYAEPRVYAPANAEHLGWLVQQTAPQVIVERERYRGPTGTGTDPQTANVWSGTDLSFLS